MKLYHCFVPLTLLLNECNAFSCSYSGNVRLSAGLTYGQRSMLLGQEEREIRKTYLSSTLPMNHDMESSPRKMSMSMSIIDRIKSMNEAQKWQALAAAFLSSIWIFQPKIDVILGSVWDTILHSQGLLPTMFRHDHWEWGLAVSAFFVWIHGFWICDYLCQKATKKGISHPLRQYRLQDQWDMLKFNQQQNKQTDRKPPMSAMNPWHSQAWIFEVPLYIIPLYLWDIFDPRRAGKLALIAAPTTFQICKDVTLGLLLYDFGFFLCHYFLFHKIPFFYKAFHKKHHTNAEVRASDQVRLSFVEEVFDVGISILALRFLKAHPLSRTIYNIIITFLLTELHSGYVLDRKSVV